MLKASLFLPTSDAGCELDLVLNDSSQVAFRYVISSSGELEEWLPESLPFTKLTKDVFSCYESNIKGALNFSNLTEVIGGNSSPLYGTFGGCTGITSVSFPELTTVSGGYSTFTATFRGCTGITGAVEFPKLESAMNFDSAFEGCTGITSVSFPNLVHESGDYWWGHTFANCTSLESVSMPKVVSTGNSDFYGTFLGCTSLKYVDFSGLQDCGIGSFCNTFEGCTSLTTISFPSLGNVYDDEDPNFSNIFYGCNSLKEVHFKKSVSSCKAFTNSYMGCPSTTKILFDL